MTSVRTTIEPLPTPCKVLPKSSMMMLGAKELRIPPAANSTMAIKIAGFRPNIWETETNTSENIVDASVNDVESQIAWVVVASSALVII